MARPIVKQAPVSRYLNLWFGPAAAVRQRLGGMLLVVGLLLLAFSGLFALQWRMDQDFFRKVIAEKIHKRPGEPGFVEEVLDYVYYNHGFAKNRDFFILPPLEATPRQVYEGGGDCADKSRLIMAMLESVGVHTTMYMLGPCRGCKIGHTVAEVRSGGMTAMVDPVYRIIWPKAGGGYYSARELMRDQDAFFSRIYDLQIERGPWDKINGMSRDLGRFRYAMTFNWDRLPLARDLLLRAGLDPFHMDRPRVLEDPKLFFACFCLIAGLMCGAASLPLLRTNGSKNGKIALAPA